MDYITGLIDRILKVYSSKKPSRENEVTFRVEIPRTGDYGGYEDRPGKPIGPPATWYPLNNKVMVRDHEIPGGLLYVGTNLPDSYGFSNDACLINPNLPIQTAEPWGAGDEMGYYPQYGQIPAKCRGAYLKWLSDGREEPEACIGYVFLFFYGLERRLIVDGSNGLVSARERSDIIDEVKRLLTIYGRNLSFKRYATNLLAIEWAVFQNDKPVPPYIDFNDCYCIEPFRLLLARNVAAGNPIPADMALNWFRLHPKVSLKTPARRCIKKFNILFTWRYKRKFGDGIIVKPNKTRLKIDYRAASPSIRSNRFLNALDLPDPFILTAPLKKIGSIVDECTQELEPYSRYMGRKDSDPKSLTALSLIPGELIRRTSGAKIIRERLTEVCNNGLGFLPVGSLYKKIYQKAPEKLMKQDLVSLAAFVENIGFGLAPDIRYHNMKCTTDSNIVVFPGGHGKDFRPSKEFNILGTILRLGAMVCQIDQEIAPAEEIVLQNLVQDNRELTNIEKDSLLAFLHWSVRTPQNATGLKARLAEISEVQKSAISHILISVAQADGVIRPEEIKQLEKLYTTLGLNKEQVSGDIHVLAADKGPVTVSRRDPDTSLTIPRPAKPVGAARGCILDKELIRIRLEETKQVKRILERIFTDREDEEPDPIPTDATDPSDPLSSLDEAHQKLFKQLVSRQSWVRADFRDVCKNLGLMADGAMDFLNEWALDNTKAPLVEDGEILHVDLEIAEEIFNVQ